MSIIDPVTRDLVDLKSDRGFEILKNYLENLVSQEGGMGYEDSPLSVRGPSETYYSNLINTLIESEDITPKLVDELFEKTRNSYQQTYQILEFMKSIVEETDITYDDVFNVFNLTKGDFELTKDTALLLNNASIISKLNEVKILNELWYDKLYKNAFCLSGAGPIKDEDETKKIMKGGSIKLDNEQQIESLQALIDNLHDFNTNSRLDIKCRTTSRCQSFRIGRIKKMLKDKCSFLLRNISWNVDNTYIYELIEIIDKFIGNKYDENKFTDIFKDTENLPLLNALVNSKTKDIENSILYATLKNMEINNFLLRQINAEPNPAIIINKTDLINSFKVGERYVDPSSNRIFDPFNPTPDKTSKQILKKILTTEKFIDTVIESGLPTRIVTDKEVVNIKDRLIFKIQSIKRDSLIPDPDWILPISSLISIIDPSRWTKMHNGERDGVRTYYPNDKNINFSNSGIIDESYFFTETFLNDSYKFFPNTSARSAINYIDEYTKNIGDGFEFYVNYNTDMDDGRLCDYKLTWTCPLDLSINIEFIHRTSSLITVPIAKDVIDYLIVLKNNNIKPYDPSNLDDVGDFSERTAFTSYNGSSTKEHENQFDGFLEKIYEFVDNALTKINNSSIPNKVLVYKSFLQGLINKILDEKKIGDWNQITLCKKRKSMLFTQDRPCFSRAAYLGVVACLDRSKNGGLIISSMPREVEINNDLVFKTIQKAIYKIRDKIREVYSGTTDPKEYTRDYINNDILSNSDCLSDELQLLYNNFNNNLDRIDDLSELNKAIYNVKLLRQLQNAKNLGLNPDMFELDIPVDADLQNSLEFINNEIISINKGGNEELKITAKQEIEVKVNFIDAEDLELKTNELEITSDIEKELETYDGVINREDEDYIRYIKNKIKTKMIDLKNSFIDMFTSIFR